MKQVNVHLLMCQRIKNIFCDFRSIEEVEGKIEDEVEKGSPHVPKVGCWGEWREAGSIALHYSNEAWDIFTDAYILHPWLRKYVKNDLIWFFPIL